MMYTKIDLPYGNSILKAGIPTRNLAYVLSRQAVEGLENEREGIVSSLQSPIGCPSLRDCVNKNDKVVILVTDNTRACPDDRLVPPILAELEGKIPKENVTIIVALGLHEHLDKQELIKKLGRNIVENYNVMNHDVNQTVNIGTTSRGTPVDINTKVVEADFRISTGFIEPHLFAGFSGGRKSIKSINTNIAISTVPFNEDGALNPKPIIETVKNVNVEAGGSLEVSYVFDFQYTSAPGSDYFYPQIYLELDDIPVPMSSQDFRIYEEERAGSNEYHFIVTGLTAKTYKVQLQLIIPTSNAPTTFNLLPVRQLIVKAYNI